MKLVLETKRLLLIPLALQDLEWLHDTFTHAFVRQYLWDDVIIPKEQTKEILLVNEQYFENHSWGLWKIKVKDNSSCVGFVGLWYFFEEPQPQLLYGLLPKYSGQGYASEASKAVLDYAFGQLKFSYLIAACDTPHEASKRVCERLGMQLVEEKEVQGKRTTFFRINHENRSW